MTAEVDEEVMKEDISMELLPEPLLIILSPPPPFLPVPGKPTMVWHKWLKAFEDYVEALGEHELSDSSRCVLLQNCLGRGGQHVFSALFHSESTYAAAVSALTLYFTSEPTSQMYRLIFHQRAQMPEETVEEFVSALEVLLQPCNYGDLGSQLILDQLIEKTNVPLLRERLLLEKETLTLDKALVVGKEVESVFDKSRIEFDVHEVSVDIGEDPPVPVPIKAKRGRPRKGEERTKTKSKPVVRAKTKNMPVVKPQNKTKAPLMKTRTRSSRYKVHDSVDLCVSEDHEDTAETVNKTNPATDTDNDKAEDSDVYEDGPLSSSSSQKMEEQNLDKASEGAERDRVHEDEDSDKANPGAKLKGPYCPICVNRRFRDTHKLSRHMRMHTKEKPFSCPFCSLTFSQPYHMTRHLRNQHGAGQYVCSTCGISLESPAELQSHRKSHMPRVLSCPYCEKTFTRIGSFISHTMSHVKQPNAQTEGQSSQESDDGKNHEEIPSSGKDNHESNGDDADDNVAENASGDCDSQEKGPQVRVKTEKDTQGEAPSRKGKVASKLKKEGHFCPICINRCFRGSNKLARHMRTHTKEKPFGCTVCDLTFSQSYHMTRHMRKQHGLGQYICSKCGKHLGSWLELKAHKKTHAVEGLTCLACDKTFKDKAALASHLKLHKKIQASPRSLVCGDCGKVFGRIYHLKRHILTHRKESKGELYTCPNCQKTFAFPEDLNKHLEIHVKENSGTCPKCNKTFSSPEELEAHMEVHEKSYSCSTCGKKFKVEYALKKHEQGHQNEQYFCYLCNKRFIKMSHYKRHIMVHNRRETKCPHCDSIFLKINALKYHLRTHTEERPHQCSCCIETFEEEEELEQHCLKHKKFKKERPYSCTRCDLAYSTLVELTEHMSSHDGEQPQNCPVCGKTFLNKNKLEKHLSIHTGERPHLCSVCGNGFPSAASLKLHVHIHTGEKPFQCGQCTKSFRSSSGLRLHGRQHMAVRPTYACPECGRTYGRMTELKMHQRYHTGDKPYSCSCCNKRFISKDKLNVHMRIHTGERPYSCPHCGQTFTQTGDRNRHISKYHPDDPVEPV